MATQTNSGDENNVDTTTKNITAVVNAVDLGIYLQKEVRVVLLADGKHDAIKKYLHAPIIAFEKRIITAVTKPFTESKSATVKSQREKRADKIVNGTPAGTISTSFNGKNVRNELLEITKKEEKACTMSHIYNYLQYNRVEMAQIRYGRYAAECI